MLFGIGHQLYVNSPSLSVGGCGQQETSRNYQSDFAAAMCNDKAGPRVDLQNQTPRPDRMIVSSACNVRTWTKRRFSSFYDSNFMLVITNLFIAGQERMFRYATANSITEEAALYRQAAVRLDTALLL